MDSQNPRYHQLTFGGAKTEPEGRIGIWMRDICDEDHPELIDVLHGTVMPRQTLWVDPGELLTTSGAQNSALPLFLEVQNFSNSLF